MNSSNKQLNLMEMSLDGLKKVGEVKEELEKNQTSLKAINHPKV
jgi:hypothetical protein